MGDIDSNKRYTESHILGLLQESRKQILFQRIPDSKVHGANMRPIWGRLDPGGPHVGPMNFAIWDVSYGCVSQNETRKIIDISERLL